MAILAHYDNKGNILGFYDKSVHKTIPTPNIKINKKDWEEHVSLIKKKCVKNGKVVDYIPIYDIEKHKRSKLHQLFDKVSNQINDEMGDKIDNIFNLCSAIKGNTSSLTKVDNIMVLYNQMQQMQIH